VYGWGGRRPHLAVFVKPLVESGHRVIAFDLPSHNESDAGELAPGRTTIVECAEAVAAVVATHGPARAIVAHSLGAKAVALAAAAGASVGRLVFLAPMGDFSLYLDLLPTVTASDPASAKVCASVLTGASDSRCLTPTFPELRPAPTIHRCCSSTIQTTPTVPTQQASGSSKPGPVRNS
jgi:pimeloyl-ACP methyl ester carboxylesterase